MHGLSLFNYHNGVMDITPDWYLGSIPFKSKPAILTNVFIFLCLLLQTSAS